MDRSTCAATLGTALTEVVASICKRHGSAPSRALTALAIATNCLEAQNIEAWFTIMRGRYAARRHEYMKSEEAKALLEEVKRTVESMVGSGCQISEFDSQIHIVHDMVSAEGVNVTQALLADHITTFVATFAALNRNGRVSASEMATFYMEGPVCDAKAENGWWLKDRPLYVKRRRVALRAIPPTLLIEYECPRIGSPRSTGPSSTATLRHRTVHLDEVFRETGSVLPLARRLSKSCACLGLAESDLVSYLTRLQDIAKNAAIADDPDLEDDAAAYDPRRHTQQTSNRDTAPPSNAAAGGQKADLGLLYRDREAALRDVDLQQADDVTIAEFKSAMDETYNKIKLKPGDPGYKYDVRKTFQPKAKSEWDDDDDD
jgi:hypothetical protein